MRYVSFDTKSDEDSETCPSTPKQKLLGEQLVKEMLEMGISDAHMDESGYVYGTIPGDPALPTVGLIAHMDTSPDASGKDVTPRIVAYDGGDICLNEALQIWLREKEFPSLTRNRGKHLVVTDGTTLLGADDKAGLAEIMSAAAFLMRAKMNHATVKLGFTPDEEIGRGADRFDVVGFAADYASTVDGGTLGELEYENFNAASGCVTVQGANIHPGSAKNKMKNSMTMAMEFHNLLPKEQVPEKTEGYEGFFHLTDMEGCVENTKLHYIIRDHDMEKFQEKKRLFLAAGKTMEEKYGGGTFRTEVKDSYFNMKEKILPHMHIIHRAEQAMQASGVMPVIVPIRGGTDGARLSYEGLPCPNICTGGENFHGKFEYIPVEDMETVVKIILDLVTTF